MSVDSTDTIPSDEPGAPAESGGPAVYQIRIGGHLGPEWADWLEGMTVTHEVGGESLLTGTVIDQAALHGLLKKVRDLGQTLLSVNRAGPGPTADPGE